MTELSIRDARESDLSFILANWLSHYKNHSSFAKRIRSEEYFANHQLVAKGILMRPSTRVSVAHVKGDDNLLLGFLVSESFPDGCVVHFTYVKKAFRKLGICRELFKHSQISEDALTFTHWTYDVDGIVKSKPNYIYNPYRL